MSRISSLDRSLRPVLLFFTLSLLICFQGCTLIQTTYNQAPEITYWWLDGYVNINSKQKPGLIEDLAQIHHWHRTTQLAQYQEILKQLDSKVQSDLTVDGICTSIEPSIKTKANDLIVAFEPALTHLALGMQSEQLKTLQRKFDKNNKDWRRDWLGSANDRVAFRTKKDVEIAEWLYGRLSNSQHELLRELVLESPFEADKTYEERLRKQADAVETLRQLINERSNFEEAQKTMHLLLIRSTFESPDLDFREYFYRNLRSQCARAVKFHNSTNEKQRQHAFKVLQSLEQDFTELQKKN